MFWKKCRTVVALALIAGVCGVGIGAGRGDQPGPGASTPATANDERPAGERPDPQTREIHRPTDEQRAQLREALRAELAKADKALEDAEVKFAAARGEVRGSVIAIEEKLRELEHRQAWDREQQRRNLQNLETTLRDWQAQQKALEAKVRDRQIELEQARTHAVRVKELADRAAISSLESEKVLTHYEALRRTVENETIQAKQLEADIAATRAKLELATKDALVGEEQRTADRVKLRRQLADAEEMTQAQERTLSRQRDRVAADVEALAAKLRQVDGAPEPARPAGPDVRDLQRQVEALQRELNDLRRDLKRAPKPE